jgi:bifunctional non-homologous end joining protein LigD
MSAVALSSLDKVLWPEPGFTKGQMIEYYRRIAPVLLPHLRDRPLTLGRFPSGVEGRGFAQNECRGAPEWLRTYAVRLRDGTPRRFCVVDDVESLLWVANQNTIELHPFLYTVVDPARPTSVVFDLDPAAPADVLAAGEVALRLRDLLAERGLAAVLKTSGSLGLHVLVPLNTPTTFAETKAFARKLAAQLAEERPEQVTDAQRRSARAGKVLVDWLQNDPMRSTVAPYSLRATPWPTVSTPVAWEEVEEALAGGRAEHLTFLADDVLERVQHDPFAPALEVEQSLPST